MVGQWLALHAPERLDRMVIANSSANRGSSRGWDDHIGPVRLRGTAVMTGSVPALVYLCLPDNGG